MILEDLLVLVLGGWLIAIALMLVLWISYLFTKEPAIVDIGWGASIGLATCWMFFTAPLGTSRQWIVLFFVLFWSIRLVSLLILRLLKRQKDQRYVELSKHWEKGQNWKYLIFFQAQAFTVAILTLPIAFTMLASTTTWTYLDTLGCLLFVIGASGEALADHQMARFRGNPVNRKGVCNVGLWRYSRHPNYFFESIIWISFAIFALNQPFGYIGLLSPVLLIFSILKITGIPPTEKRLLKSKGDAYRDYQQTTSAFIPLPQRKKR